MCQLGDGMAEIFIFAAIKIKMKQATLNRTKNDVLNAVRKAANKLGINIESETNNALSLYYSGGLFSFGNKIDVRLKTIDTNKCIIHVASRSAAQIQVVDWGTNNELEENIISEVKYLLG